MMNYVSIMIHCRFSEFSHTKVVDLKTIYSKINTKDCKQHSRADQLQMRTCDRFQQSSKSVNLKNFVREGQVSRIFWPIEDRPSWTLKSPGKRFLARTQIGTGSKSAFLAGPIGVVMNLMKFVILQYCHSSSSNIGLRIILRKKIFL